MPCNLYLFYALQPEDNNYVGLASDTVLNFDSTGLSQFTIKINYLINIHIII